MVWVFIALLVVLVIIFVVSCINKRRFVSLFDRGNVLVSGMRGRGKDFAFCVVVNARKRDYISNVVYSSPRKRFKCFPLDLKVWELAGNTFNDLVTGEVKTYSYPYPDGLDYYVSDAAVYFPASHFQELAKKYKSIPMFQALSRHLGDCNVHCNTQVQTMLWDKMRLQSDTYIVMKGCTKLPLLPIFRLSAVVYDLAESAEKQLNPPHFGMGKNAKAAKNAFEVAHGHMYRLRFFTRLPYRYDSRRFKKILENNLVDYEN